jgi:hypothetical protein
MGNETSPFISAILWSLPCQVKLVSILVSTEMTEGQTHHILRQIVRCLGGLNDAPREFLSLVAVPTDNLSIHPLMYILALEGHLEFAIIWDIHATNIKF